MMGGDQATKLRELVNSQKAQQVTTKKIPVALKPTKKGRIVAITSGKGGVGKTNFVINLALNLARHHKKVVIVDLDLGLANIDILLNLTPKFNIEDFIQGRKTLDEILVEGPKGIKILPGGSGLQNLADLDDFARDNFIHGFMSLVNEYDYILLDTAAGIQKNVIEFVLIADDAIIVTTPEPTAITDAYAAIKIIGTRNKDMNLFLLFNMVKTVGEAKTYSKKVGQVIHQFLKIDVTNLGYVFTDPCVHQSIMKRKPFSLIYPYANASRCLHQISRKFLQSTSGKERTGAWVIKKLYSLFKKKEPVA